MTHEKVKSRGVVEVKEVEPVLLGNGVNVVFIYSDSFDVGELVQQLDSFNPNVANDYQRLKHRQTLQRLYDAGVFSKKEVESYGCIVSREGK